MWPETYVRQLGHCHLPVLFSQPCISVGNVGQLTVDLIINTLKLDRVGYLQDPGLLPLVGNDAFDHTTHTGQGHLHTAAEGGCVYTQYPEVGMPEKGNYVVEYKPCKSIVYKKQNFFPKIKKDLEMAYHTHPLKRLRNKGICYYPASVPSHLKIQTSGMGWD